MTDATHACVPCGLAEPRRPAFFDGKLLLARDFEDEQGYHVYKRQLLNSALHGTGTVCGLAVHAHPALDCRARFAVLEPGLALDCCGQEIIVPKAVAIPVADLVAATPDLAAALTGDNDLVIALKRCDRPGELAPVILADCEGAAEGGRPGRILEGFDFHLFAAAPGELTPAVHAHTPRLDWRQTLTFAGAEPAALAFDEDAGHAYVAVVFPPEASGDPVPPDEGAAGEGEGGDSLPGSPAIVSGASRIFVYERRNQDLVTALEGPAFPIDMAVSPAGDQVYVAYGGSGETAPGIAVYRKSDIRARATPIATIELAGAARIAVSPRTGALFALHLDTGAVVAWSQESINAWAATATPGTEGPAGSSSVSLAGWTARAPEDARSATFEASPDGRYLLVVDGVAPSAGAVQPLRIVDIGRLFGGEPAERADLLAAVAGETPVAAAWSFDSGYVFLLSAAGEDTELHAVLRRYEFREADNVLLQRGRGVATAGRAIDLAIAPGERWAYALVGRGSASGEETVVLALDGERLKAAGSEPDPDGAAAEVALPGRGRRQRLVPTGRQLYVAAVDEDAESQPDRGLVAVIEPDEADCSERFRQAVDGCPACASAGAHHVVLAHLPGYVAAATPRIVDADPQEGEVAVDNFAYRLLVPSAVTLKEVVECILAEGIAEGPPGPRGDPGLRGPGITDVSAEALASGAAPTVTLSPIPGDPEGDLELHIGLPAGAPGDAGPRGPGITEAVATMLAPDAAATAVLEPIAGDAEGDFRLLLGIPAGAPGEPPPAADLGHVSALSWRHGVPYKNWSEIAEMIKSPGLVIGFDRPVRAETLLQVPGETPGTGRSFVFEALGRNDNSEGDFCLCPLPATCELLASVKVEDGIIVDVKPAGAAAVVRGVRLLLDNFHDGIDVSLLRIVLRCDFVLDAKRVAIDGNHLGGRLPTGDGVAGGLFESWITTLPANVQ